MNRQDKLARLDERKKPIKPDEYKAVFEEHLKKLSEVLEVKVTLDNIDDLITELKAYQPITKELTQLTNALKNFKLPESKDKVIKTVEVENKQLTKVTESLSKLTKALEDKKASQNPRDYVPYRRVVYLGNTYYFDDNPTPTSGGGGGISRDVTTNNGTAIAVTNPDGSNIGGSSGVAAYSDSGGTDRKGLVDADRHVQVDVLTAPTTTVQATDLDIRNLSSATDSVAVTGSVSATLSEPISVDDNGGSLTVDASNLDIRDLTFASDKVDASGTVLGAGTNAIGKLSANSGVDIGDVDVTSVIPGTGATNLGKAIDSAVGANDVGVGILGEVHTESQRTDVADGDYDTFSLTAFQEIRTRDQRAQDIDGCNATTGWTVIGNDTANLAVSTNHVFGTGALTFDKVDGAANTVFAGIQKTLTAINIQEKFEDGGNVAFGVYLPSLTNVVSVFLRLGTNSSNYNEWEWPVSDLSASTWLALRSPTNQPTNASTGNGWDTSAITYVAVGVEFNSQSNTLAGIVVDNIHFVQARVTDASIDNSVTTSVNSPNINIHRVAGNQTDVNTGNASAGTQRVVNATDDPNLSAIKTAVETIDNAIAGNEMQVDVITSALPSGAATSAKQDTIIGHVDGIEGLLTTIDSDTGNLVNIATYLNNRFGGGKTPVPFTVTASGDTTIHTPASGKAIRLFSIDALTDPDQSTTPLIKVLIGTNEKLRGHALGKWEIFTGAADEVLKINLSEASSVSGTAILEEFTP